MTSRSVKLTRAAIEAGCFYCGRKGVRFDADHAPIPYRHGGTEVVPACSHCHNLKDRLSYDRWSPAEQQAVETGSPANVTAAVSMACFGITTGELDWKLSMEQVLRAADATTTPEARIAVFKLLNSALDATDGAALDDSWGVAA